MNNQNINRKFIEEKLAVYALRAVKYFCYTDFSSISRLNSLSFTDKKDFIIQNSEQFNSYVLKFLQVIEIVMNKLSDDAESLLGGGLNCLNGSLPAYAILEILYLMICSNKVKPLSLKDKERFEYNIEKLRQLSIPNEFNKNWHINPDVIKCFNYDTSIVKIYNGVEVSDNYNKEKQYNSTIVTSKKLLSNAIGIVEHSKKYLNNDIDKYPELVCDNNILTIEINNHLYDRYGNVNTWTNNVILFREQKEKLNADYVKICNTINEEELKYYKEYFLNNILVYFDLEMHSSFSAFSALGKDNKEIENLYYVINDIGVFVNEYCDSNKKNVKSILEDNDFVKLLGVYVDRFREYEYKVKELIIKQIIINYRRVPKILKKLFNSKDYTDYQLEYFLLKMSLSDLYKCFLKTDKKVLGSINVLNVVNKNKEYVKK